MRNCPRCGGPVDGLECPSCGPVAGKVKAGEIQDPNWWRCCDEDGRGARCSKPGTLTGSTHGSERWFCHQHYPPFRKRGYERTAPAGGFAKLLSRDAEAIAERLAIQSEPAE